MEIADLTSVDWQQPWFAPFAAVGRAIASSGDWRGELTRAARAIGVCNQAGQPIRFVLANAAAEEPYESFIARTGHVPTRALLHDVFNAVAWLTFPMLKARLNALQASAISLMGIEGTRGPLRDALTLIDENAVLVVTHRADFFERLREHDWTGLFVKQRVAWQADVRIVVFGHALLAKLAHPYKAITAHALHVPLAADAPLDVIDRCVAAALDDRLLPAVLTPLPVLGLPGWCAHNDDPRFYEDTAVFRPVNMRRNVQRRDTNR